MADLVWENFLFQLTLLGESRKRVMRGKNTALFELPLQNSADD